MRARIEDVARRSRVSMKTVSRVLNNEPNVRETTRQRVLDAVEALQYRPNLSARSLAGHKSYLLAMLYDNPSANYLLEILTGVVETCQEQHYGMVPCPLRYRGPDLLRSIETLLLQSKFDGLILTPPITDDDAVLERLTAIGVPYACISPRNRNGTIGARIDEEGASHEVVAHLAGLGHRRIAHICGDPAQGASHWRLDGYRDGLAIAGLPFDAALVVEGRFTFDSGVAATERLLALAEPPTAIFAANDDTAAGVLSVAHERGLSIPGDISICGFDDSPMSGQLYPALTTVHQPMHEMGGMATLQLLKSLGSHSTGGMVLMPHALVPRQSTGPAPCA